MVVLSRVSRREVLVGGAATAATTVAAVAGLGGCGNGGHEGSEPDAGARPTTASTPTTRHTARIGTDPFTLGVASGDPLPDRVVLWTRLAPTPLAGGTGGMPGDPVDVVWQVAADDRFTRVAAQGVASATPQDAHAVHVDAGSLDPATDYFYRFTVGDWTSPVGRARTAAAPGTPLDRLRLGVVCCQHFGGGYYAAYRHLLDEDLDLVVHLGDYIYEWPGDDGLPGRTVLPAGEPVTLDDYRLRHASYRLDPDLQAAHARYPFVPMWDDHDVTNNYTADTGPAPGDPPEALRARRAAAYRAWWEHLPLRLGPPAGPDLALYRATDLGDLVRLYLLDGRQYADEPPCRESSVSDLGDCPERQHERHHLGEAQDRWLASALAESSAAWNLVCSPTVVAGINLGSDTSPNYYLETWDGYPAARRRFLARLADGRVANPLLLSGDWHAGMVNDVHLDPEDPATPVVATELMAPAVSSPLYDAPLDANPHLRHQVLAHGYLTLQVEPERLVAELRVLDDIQRPDARVATDSVWELRPGEPRAIPVGTA